MRREEDAAYLWLRDSGGKAGYQRHKEREEQTWEVEWK
jgi:hypothetical protein